MSRETALAMATGTPSPTPAPVVEAVVSDQSPGVVEAAPKESLESTRFSHLAKKEAELQRQREEFKKEREAILAEKEKVKPVWEKIQEFEKLKASDPVAAIKLLELSETDLFNYINAQQENLTPEEKARRAAQEEIRKFQEQSAAEKAKTEEERNNRIINEFKGKITEAINSDKDKYEFSSHPRYIKESEEIAFEFTKACIEGGQDAPTAQECADYVEQYWELYHSEIGDLMKNVKKLAPKTPPAVENKDEPLRPQVNPRPTPKTLTNKTTATVASTVDRAKETPSQKRERLMSALRAMKP
jgi:succinate dehydrogenase flavin-adding protein (antitoxin of CptAB toxin-antitoxin module)